MSEKTESWGDSFVGFIFALILLAVLFSGDPDIVDSLRFKAGKWAGTIHIDQVYTPKPE